MRTATWNVHTLYRAGAMNELTKEMDTYKIDICRCCARNEMARGRNCDKKRIM
jgi:hypothetical protein